MREHPLPGTRPDRDRYDVVVVGARAAGAAVAMLLAGAGLSVLAVDRGRYGSDTPSTHALMRGGVAQLTRWGLLDRLVDLGTPAVHRTVFHYAHGEIIVPITPGAGVEALYAPRRTVLDPVLVDAAVAAGAEVRHGVAVTGLLVDDHGRVGGVRARTRAGTVPIAARLVIGADGVRSTVAAAVRAQDLHRGAHGSAVVYGYWAGVEAAGYEWAYRGGVGAGFIPTNGGEVCVFAGGPPERIRRGGPAVLADVLARASPGMAARLGAGARRGVVRTQPGRPGHLRRAHGPGWALVGDAGSWKDPLTAHGLTDALRDAELLARAVAVGFGDDRAEDSALAGYQEVRDRLALPLLAVSDEIAGCGWADDEVPALLLRLSRVMSAGVEVVTGLPDDRLVASGVPT
ncbi:NAD(P)/FAD-dependent oxidoreductase [Pseudonocardia lacus]|uniref:NAD(P)/FAD-dependent oxidoreductase n=1 Tax=Pseudonocardia lacus TaxID=2835865 RepID=UPI001BDC20FB|nr:FAD-dependent monooxygenase [Pseudonocardia lacus]